MDNFAFNLIGTEDKPFAGYISSKDKTNVSPLALIRGSKNTYKKLTGTWANRDGLKASSPLDTTAAGITSEFVWDYSASREFLMRVQAQTSALADGKLQFMYNDTIYDLLTGLTNTRFVFDTWYSPDQGRNILVMCNGEDNIKYWSGGFTTVSYGTTLGISIVGSNQAAANLVISSTAPNIVVDSNDLGNTPSVSLVQGAIVFNGQPTNGQQLSLAVTGPGTTFTVNFVNVIGATAGNVLIGATTQDTLTNLLGFLNSPGTTTATHVAISGPALTAWGYTTSAQSNVLVKQDTSTTWFQDGFIEGGTVTIAGVDYTYTSDAKMFILYGVTPSPATVVPGIALQKVITVTNTPLDGYLVDMLKTINNQVWYGSYSSSNVYVASSTNFVDFTVPGTPEAGDPEFLTLDAFVNNISVRKGQAVISAGLNIWYVITFSNITVGSVLARQTTVDKQEVTYRGAAYAHEFTTNVGDDLVFLSKEQQLCIFGGFRNLFQNKYPSLSQQVRTELMEEDFTGGHLVSIGDIIYITAPINGRDWMHETRESLDNDGNVTAERFWHPPQIRNISRFTFALGEVSGYSNANPMLYQVWNTNQWHDDSPSGEPLAYDSILRFAYRNRGVRQGKTSFDKVYHEGYIADGSTLNGKCYFDYQGSSSIQPYVVNSVEEPAKYYGSSSAPSLGDSSLGTNPLAIGLIPDTNDQELLSKFRAIKQVNPVDCFEWSLEVSSSDLDSRWEILCIGVDETEANASAVEIIT